MVMQNFKKIIASFVTLITLLALTPVAANAEWQKKGTYWAYTESGTLKTGWLQDSGKWYYFNTSGNMLTGWIIDKGTWYYMLVDGSLDNSKTTNTMPNELTNAYNRLKQYVTENIHYSETRTQDGKSTYRFYGEAIDSPNEYYYTPGTDKSFQLNQGIVTRLDGKYSYEQCKDIASAYFNNSHINGYKFTVYSDGKPNSTGDYYFIIYSTTANKQVDAYYVSAMTGNVTR
jgi:hypothetical protein